MSIEPGGIVIFFNSTYIKLLPYEIKAYIELLYEYIEILPLGTRVIDIKSESMIPFEDRVYTSSFTVTGIDSSGEHTFRKIGFLSLS